MSKVSVTARRSPSWQTPPPTPATCASRLGRAWKAITWICASSTGPSDGVSSATRVSSRLAYVLALLGEGERGLDLLARAIGRYTTRVTAPVLAYGTTTSSAYLAAGAYEDARAEIRQGLAAAAERHAWGHLASLLRLDAELLAHEDDLVGARARLDEALAAAAEQDMRPEVAHCHLGLGKLYRRTGN